MQWTLKARPAVRALSSVTDSVVTVRWPTCARTHCQDLSSIAWPWRQGAWIVRSQRGQDSCSLKADLSEGGPERLWPARALRTRPQLFPRRRLETPTSRFGSLRPPHPPAAPIASRAKPPSLGRGGGAGGGLGGPQRRPRAGRRRSSAPGRSVLFRQTAGWTRSVLCRAGPERPFQGGPGAFSAGRARSVLSGRARSVLFRQPEMAGRAARRRAGRYVPAASTARRMQKRLVVWDCPPQPPGPMPVALASRLSAGFEFC